MDINKILEKEPYLTPTGLTGPELQADFDQDFLQQIQICVEWLSKKKLQKTVNPLANSYAIKHLIEREVGTYIANGCLIAAVIQLGIPYNRVEPDSVSIILPIGTKELYKNDPVA